MLTPMRFSQRLLERVGRLVMSIRFSIRSVNTEVIDAGVTLEIDRKEDSGVVAPQAIRWEVIPYDFAMLNREVERAHRQVARLKARAAGHQCDPFADTHPSESTR